MRQVAGIDIGGTKAHAVLIDMEKIEIVGEEKAPSSDHGPTLIRILTNLVHKLKDQTNQKIEAIGLGIAGLSKESGFVHYSPNLPRLIRFPVGSKLEEALGIPVVATNDATAGTVAEWELGAGKNNENFAMITLGTGIGTGFVLDGHLLKGSNGFAGESGHMVIDINGPKHISGQKGPWEYFASGTALSRLSKEAALTGEFPWGIKEAGSAEKVTSHHLAAGVKQREPDSLRILNEFTRGVSQGLANLVLILDIDLIIIGGGLCALGEPLRLKIEFWLHEILLGAQHRPNIKVELAELGEVAGALGAALLAARTI